MQESTTVPYQSTQTTDLIVQLRTLPGDDRPVYLSGNFNDWAVADGRYQLLEIGPGWYHYRFDLTAALPKRLEYKYHRSPDWSAVETQANGEVPPNRVLAARPGWHTDKVINWQKNGLYYREELLPRIEMISEEFEMPQLIRTRRVAALLPHDYDRTSRRYPVLYLQDGQNLFDDYAPFGNWALDKKLAMLAARGHDDVIVIAIDHAAEQRAAEYTPSYATRIGSGEGEQYAGWLAETLKPYVDRAFRTLPDRANTGIGGSSLGGLISIYAGLLYPEVFGKLMVFSPSLWVSPDISRRSGQREHPFYGRAYLYGGGREGSGMVPLLQQFKEALLKQGSAGNMDIELRIDPQGRHAENYWGKEFPRALEWLFFNQPNDLL